MSFSRQTLTLAAAISTMATVGIGLSLTIPLLSLRMDMAGYSAQAIGLQTALGAIATLIFAPFIPRAAHRMGVRRLMLSGLALGVACLLAFGLISNIALWFPIRLLFGASLTILFVMSEYWINAAAPPDRRGLVMGIYATALALGFSIGPAILSLSGTEGLRPFLIGAGLFVAAGVPIAQAGGGAPEMATRGKIPLLAFLTAAPVATLAAFLFGAIETGGLSLLPVYALRLNFSPEQGALCVGLFAIGSVVFEVPLGYLSDKMDRRLVLLGIASAGLVGTLTAPFVTDTFQGLAVVLVLWGGVIGGLYPLGLAHLGSRYRGPELATANAAFVMFYSAGMLLGPPVLGAAMDIWSPNGFFIGMSAAFAAYIAVVLSRLSQTRDAKVS